jgi:hypothetical protein
MMLLAVGLMAVLLLRARGVAPERQLVGRVTRL